MATVLPLNETQRPLVLNVGVTRFSVPLEETERKKLESLAPVAALHVVSFATSLRGRRLHEPVELTLVPLFPFAPIRFLALVIVSFAIGLRLLMAKRLSVVVSQSPYEAVVGVMLGAIARLLRRPVLVVTEVHGDWVEALFLYRKLPASGVVRPVLRAWARFTLRRSDRLRTISSFLAEKVREEAPDAPVHVFPTYTDFERFLADEPNRDGHEERERQRARERAPDRILSAGALYPVKGFSHLLRAIRRVARTRPGVRLEIAGHGPLRERLEREAKELGITDNVRFHGALSPDELRERYRRALVFVLSSLSEGLGRVIWEAMASSLPVVASNVGGVPDLVEHGRTGFLVEPGDEEAMAERILWLLENPEEASRMGRAGRAEARNWFSTERYVEGYRELFSVAPSPAATD
jgi:glycosyltransferase involved in cell wall biosynthesis